MNFHYDRDADAVYFRFEHGRYVESEEVADGIVVDYDADRRILGLEVLDASKRFPKGFSQQFRTGSLHVDVGELPRVPA